MTVALDKKKEKDAKVELEESWAAILAKKNVTKAFIIEVIQATGYDTVATMHRGNTQPDFVDQIVEAMLKGKSVDHRTELRRNSLKIKVEALLADVSTYMIEDKESLEVTNVEKRIADANELSNTKSVAEAKTNEADNIKKKAELVAAMDKVKAFTDKMFKESHDRKDLQNEYDQLEAAMKKVDFELPPLKESSNEAWETVTNDLTELKKARDGINFETFYKTVSVDSIVKGKGLTRGFIILDTVENAIGVLSQKSAEALTSTDSGTEKQEYFSSSQANLAQKTYEKCGDSWEIAAEGEAAGFVGQGLGSVAVKSNTTITSTSIKEKELTSSQSSTEFIALYRFESKELEVSWLGEHPQWTPDAIKAVKKVSSDTQSALTFLKSFGTHVSKQITLGAIATNKLTVSLNESIETKKLSSAIGEAFQTTNVGSASYISAGFGGRATAAVDVQINSVASGTSAGSDVSVVREKSLTMTAMPSRMLGMTNGTEFVNASGYSSNWEVISRSNWTAVWEVLPVDKLADKSIVIKRSLIRGYRELLMAKFLGLKEFWPDKPESKDKWESIDKWEEVLKSFTLCTHHINHCLAALPAFILEQIVIDKFYKEVFKTWGPGISDEGIVQNMGDKEISTSFLKIVENNITDQLECLKFKCKVTSQDNYFRMEPDLTGLRDFCSQQLKDKNKLILNGKMPMPYQLLEQRIRPEIKGRSFRDAGEYINSYPALSTMGKYPESQYPTYIDSKKSNKSEASEFTIKLNKLALKPSAISGDKLPAHADYTVTFDWVYSHTTEQTTDQYYYNGDRWLHDSASSLKNSKNEFIGVGLDIFGKNEDSRIAVHGSKSFKNNLNFKLD